MKRFLSGVQPSGYLTLGNYLGALRNWVSIQDEGECFFCVADLHALTSSWGSSLNHATRLTAASYLASGLDPSKHVFFVQSSVPYHTELLWLLGCITPISRLNRLAQFKAKTRFGRAKASLALYAYPVLMAADILLYRATHVPIGEDQRQHLELARDIAILFNKTVGENYFCIPQPCIVPLGSRIMSLQDGTKKMSKSDPSDMSRINLTDSDDDIKVKVLKAKTDSMVLPVMPEELVSRPEVLNLLTIYSTIAGKTIAEALKNYGGGPFLPFKQDLANLLVAIIGPIRDRIQSLLHGPELDLLLDHGSQRALEIAKESLDKVRNLLGLYRTRKPRE